jgi:Glycosyl hydrolase catalytic core
MRYAFKSIGKLVLSAIVLSAQLAVGQTVSSFPISNPSFEGTYVPTADCTNITGDVAPGWDDNTCWDDKRPVIRYAKDNVNPRSGASSQKITLVSGNRVQFTQTFSLPFEIGKGYTISGWMRAQTPMFVTIFLREAGPPYSGYTSKLVKLSTTWTRFEMTGATDGTAGGLFILTDSPGTFWIDDVTAQSETLPASNPTPPSAAVPRAYFGIHFNYPNTPWPRVSNAIGSVRIWDAGPNLNGSGIGSQWTDVNGTTGNYIWSGLDARVAAALANNADIVYTLGGRTPQWASARPDAFSPYGPGQCAEPKSDQVWQDWIRTIATRYKGKIKLWEVWNEPDLPDFYCGTPDKLIDLARQAYTVLKQVDPANRVLTPGFSGYAGPGYLDYYLAQGGGQYSDIVAYHFYVDKPEDNARWRMANVQSTIRRYGAQTKPLWNTEQGWIEIPSPTLFPQAKGAAYVARAHLLLWAYGLGRFYYYTWDNQWNQIQFVQADNVTLTPSGTAYREIAQWMTERVMESLTTDINGTYVATLRDAGGKKYRVLWNPLQQIQFALPASWSVSSQRTLAGVTTSLAGKTAVAIGESPLLLEQTQSTANEIVLDNLAVSAGDTSRSFTGTWCLSSSTNQYGANSLYSCGAGVERYRWTPNVASAGAYDVYVWWSTHPNRSSNVPVSVTSPAGTVSKAFNQKVGGGQWVLHGRYNFVAGKTGYVEVSDVNGQAAADAIRLVKVQ